MTGVPKYQQIVDWIEHRIRSSELKDGDKLETEQEICKRFQVSRQTVRQALSRLETIGTLERVQGSGSYVRNKKRHNLDLLKILPMSEDHFLTHLLQQNKNLVHYLLK